jgi:MFS family permease
VLIRKRYSLYYFLELLFGARKQIFITFGPWVLIKAHGHEASDIARLLLIASASGLVFKPLSGLAIDRFGERMVLVADGVILAAVCIGYGYAGFFTASAEGAAALAGACFIADNLLFSLGAGRSIYVSRLTVDREELTATLAMGVSVNHIVSMLLPAAAGLIWVSLGYEAVFLGAAVLALGIAFAATFVPRKAAARDGSIAHEDRSPIDAYWRRYADAFSVMRSALRAPAGVSRRPPRRDEGSDS